MQEKENINLDAVELTEEEIKMVSSGKKSANEIGFYTCPYCDETFPYEKGDRVSAILAILDRREHIEDEHK